MPADNVLFAFALTLFAGLSTGIGSAIAFFARHTNTRFLAVSLGFSAGVMLYVSFVEILPKAREALGNAWGEETAGWAAVAAFFGGIVLIALIDRFVPESKNPHEAHAVEELNSPTPGAPGTTRSRASLYKTGMFTALAIAIHNFPEGFATFAAALSDPKLGIPIAIAIAIHNIPEGIAVSVPIFYATGNRRKAFVFSFLSGLSEPLGALVGYLVLRSVFNEVVFGLSFAAVGGIMVYISLDELLPSAQKFGEHHHAIAGVMVGMAVMASSLLLFL